MGKYKNWKGWRGRLRDSLVGVAIISRLASYRTDPAHTTALSVGTSGGLSGGRGGEDWDGGYSTHGGCSANSCYG